MLRQMSLNGKSPPGVAAPDGLEARSVRVVQSLKVVLPDYAIKRSLSSDNIS
jgi:hypothetical protein